MADHVPVGAWVFAAGVLLLIAISLPSVEDVVHAQIAWLLATAGVLLVVGVSLGLAFGGD